MSGHDDGGLGHRVASGQTGSGGAKGGAPMDINSNFGRKADEMYALMHGHDVKMSEPLEEIIRALASSSSNSGGGDSGGGSAQAQSSEGPILNSTASQQSMADLVGGRNASYTPSSRSDDGGGRGI